MRSISSAPRLVLVNTSGDVEAPGRVIAVPATDLARKYLGRPMPGTALLGRAGRRDGDHVSSAPWRRRSARFPAVRSPTERCRCARRPRARRRSCLARSKAREPSPRRWRAAGPRRRRDVAARLRLGSSSSGDQPGGDRCPRPGPSDRAGRRSVASIGGRRRIPKENTLKARQDLTSLSVAKITTRCDSDEAAARAGPLNTVPPRAGDADDSWERRSGRVVQRRAIEERVAHSPAVDGSGAERPDGQARPGSRGTTLPAIRRPGWSHQDVHLILPLCGPGQAGAARNRAARERRPLASSGMGHVQTWDSSFGRSATEPVQETGDVSSVSAASG